MDEEKKYALLIDADNISPKYVDIILSEAKEFGIVSVRRIYADWTDTTKASWKEILLENSMTPIQQYTYTHGKNSSDSAMIIDAMDILYGDNVDGFVLVSSDSDFTRLAMRIRESGKDIIGMGESKTPSAFVKACRVFKTLDVLYRASLAIPEKRLEAKEEKEAETEATPITSIDTIKSTVISLIESKSQEDGWLFLGELGNYLLKEFPDFDCRNYGFNKLTELVKKFDEVETKSERKKRGITLVYARKKLNGMENGKRTNGLK